MLIPSFFGYPRGVTPNEKNVVKSLVAVAWADGHLEAPEAGVFEGMLVAFDATDDEEAEVLEYAKTRRTLDDIPLTELSPDDRELLLTNAALLAAADGEKSESETQLLERLWRLLEFGDDEARKIIDAAVSGAPSPTEGQGGR